VGYNDFLFMFSFLYIRICGFTGPDRKIRDDLLLPGSGEAISHNLLLSGTPGSLYVIFASLHWTLFVETILSITKP
jgi:hypothetical protein